jgi:phenylethanolamine N-methyltransferase
MDSLNSSEEVEKDFGNFSPSVYLKEYYSEIQKEDEHHLNWLAKAYADVTGDLTLLEFGGGPTLYQLMSAAAKVKEIHFSDYLESNLTEVKKWKNRESNAFNWNKVTATALLAEGITPTTDAINAREEILREKITKFSFCNAFQKNPLGSDAVVQYDIVNTHFVAESITDNRDEWKQIFANISSCVKPGGKLVMAAMKHCTAWKNGPHKFPATYIGESDIVELLTANGFRKNETLMGTFPADQDDYREVIFFSSTKSL